MITIVSGLPRSGTSLTMQMVKASGFPVFWNKEPNVDQSNPRGYYEWTEQKKLWQSTAETCAALFGKVDGKAVKIFPQMLPCLSESYQYQIIYIDRPIKEVIQSQRKMQIDLGRDPSEIREGTLEKLRFLAMVYCRSFRSLVLTHQQLYNGSGAYYISKFLFGAWDGATNERLIEMNNCVHPELRHHLSPS